MNLTIIVAAVLVGIAWGTLYPAHAYTCEDVRWAVHTFSKEQVAAYAANLSSGDLAAAKACLHKHRVHSHG